MSTKPLSSGLISVQSICTEAQGEAQRQSVQRTAFLTLSGTLLSTQAEEKIMTLSYLSLICFYWELFQNIKMELLYQTSWLP